MVDVLDRSTAAPASGESAPVASTLHPEATPASPARGTGAKAVRRKPEGLPRIAYVAAALIVAVLLWGAWVTKHLLTPPATVPMASVRLEGIVSEYVQAQSHSNSPPEQVAAQTRAFMGTLDEELRKVGAGGTTVLVGEAVLSKNVPDITDQIRKAVFARVPQGSPFGPAPVSPVEATVAPPAQGGLNGSGY